MGSRELKSLESCRAVVKYSGRELAPTMFGITSALLRWSEKFALMHWLNANVHMNHTHARLLFGIATYVSAFRSLREPEGSPYIRRMVRLTGDGESFNRFARSTNDGEILAVLSQYSDMPLLTLLLKYCLKVFHEMKPLIILSVVMPKLLRGTLRAWSRKCELECATPPRAAGSLSEEETGEVAAHHYGLCDRLNREVWSSVVQLVTRFAAVLAMPATFWLMFYPLVAKRLGGPRVHVFRHKWFLACLPTVAAQFTMSIEGERRSQLLAIFMFCTAIS